YAIAVVLGAFLVFSGLGSGYAARVTQRAQASQAQPAGRPTVVAVAGIVIIALLYLVFLEPLFQLCLSFPAVVKIGLTLALIAPLAFCMGMPFPLGLARVARQMPGMIPWAWGVNGYASVLSAILATILAIHYGFTIVVGLALGLYMLAAVVLYGPLESEQPVDDRRGSG
ncbi:MAG: SAM-dependent methyltransferase, partial [Candidatus Tectomicrobia bacterium]